MLHDFPRLPKAGTASQKCANWTRLLEKGQCEAPYANQLGCGHIQTNRQPRQVSLFYAQSVFVLLPVLQFCTFNG